MLCSNNSFAANEDFLADVEPLNENGGENRVVLSINKSSGSKIYNSVNIDHEARITNSQFTVNVDNSSLTVENDFQLNLNATHYNKDSWDQGNYAIRGVESTLNLNGDVDIFVYQKDKDGADISSIGANGLWLNGSTVNIGNESSKTSLWVFAQKPDAIQVKNDSKVIFNSTHNQLVGNVLASQALVPDGNEQKNQAGYIQANFEGADSFWVGDDSYAAFSYIGSVESNKGAAIDFTFSNGAQWIYMKESSIFALTLADGGYVNLYDSDIQSFYKESGLDQYLGDDILNVDHKTVTIYNLKGSGGIFKMDLNAVNHAASDLIFIQSGDPEGKEQIFSLDLVAHDLQLLDPIQPDSKNWLVFAITGSNANQISFTDKVNEYGEGLFDYELIIDSEQLTEEDLSREEIKNNSTISKTDSPENYTKWFIKRILFSESSATLGMTGAGWAAYDAAVEMDRHDRRLSETLRNSSDATDGLWVRVNHGRSGAEQQYRWDRTGVTVGYDRQIMPSNRLGAWFSYTEGDTDFLDVKGSGEIKRYELGLFDTFDFGSHYLDFVARIGQVSSDFSVGNTSFSTTGDFDQNYAAVSAEYGYHLASATGVFFEPQVQIQVAYLESYTYNAERNLEASADSEFSTIGRIGFRAGRQIKTTSSTGELYFRGDVLHQFSDGQEAAFRDGAGHIVRQTWGDTGTWADFGIGAVWNWNNTMGIQFDVEKVTGGKTADTWLLSGRLNYLF